MCSHKKDIKHIFIIIIIIIIIVIIIIIIIIIITYSSGLDTDVEKTLYHFYCQRKQSEISSYP